MKKVNIRPFKVATAVAGIAAAALHDADADITVLHNTEDRLRGDVGAATTANGSYQGAKTARLAATKVQQAANASATKFIAISREWLKLTLGGRYSQAWDEVGFVNQTLALPRTMAKRLGLLKSLELYFKAHPEKEASGAATGAMAAELHVALVDAMSAAKTARAEAREQKAKRNAAAAALRERLQNLYRELQQFLKPNDPRWIEFGFVVPADVSVPQAPEALEVVPGSTSGRVVPSWKRSVNAARYHVYRKIVGVDAEFARVGSFTSTTADVGNLPTGAHVLFYVTAVNAAGESQASEIVEVVVL